MLDEPATKRDLLELEERLEQKLEEKLEQKLEQKFDQKLARFRDELRMDLASAINTAFEHFASQSRVFDDKYETRTTTLRHDLDSHAANTAIHVRPPPPAARRSGKPRK
jgi:hypothetical protein